MFPGPFHLWVKYICKWGLSSRYLLHTSKMYFVVNEMLLMKNINNIEVLFLEVQFCNFLTETLHGISEVLNLNSCWAVHSCIQNTSDVHLCCFYPHTKFPKVSADTGILCPPFLSGWVEIQCGVWTLLMSKPWRFIGHLPWLTGYGLFC